MCKECNREQADCKTFESVQDVVINLAEKGFTVLELECRLRYHPSTQQSYIPPISWQSVCQYCLEQYLEYNKEECLKQMIESEFQILQQNQVFITELLCLHNNIQNAYFMD